ncbi:MAG: ATP-grasp domain-containing protein [Candidatus Obscuribacterales bacterium]|nr:ATP-grasp domain-containing protein [Candidatus Obscuribacterales bacterium]
MSKNGKAWRNWNVAVTGMNASPESPGPGYAVARCLREDPEFNGRIIGIGYDVLDAGLYARNICDGGYLIPYPSAGKDALFERLKELHEAEDINVIIPCLDAEIQNFIALKDELEKLGIKMLIPSKEQFTMRAKDQLSKFCESVGVLAPESKTITNPSFFDDCESQGFEYPLMVKGIFYDAVLARNAFEAKAIMAKLVNSWGYPVLVQKLLCGDEFDLSAIGDGRRGMLGPVMMRKRALTEKGKAWAGVTVEEPGIAEVARKLIHGLSWSGPFEVEVMRTHDEKIYLIEINPRFPAWIYLSHAVNRNLPILLLKVLAGDEELDLAPAKTGTFFIRHAQELIVDLPAFESMLIDGGIASDVIGKHRTVSAV